MLRFRPVQAVLFDMDGLLLDTERLYTVGTQTVLAEFGKEFTWELKARLMGKRTEEVARMIVDHYHLPIEPHDWVLKSTEVYTKLFPDVETQPGATKFVHHLAKHRVPIAVATSSSTSSFDLKTANHSGLFSLFDLIVKGDHPEVRNAKPAPDIFLYTAKQLRSELKPEDFLVVEDSPLGVQGGLAGGMQVLMIPDTNLEPKHRKEATLSLHSLHQLDPQVFGLPPYNYKPVTHVIFDMDGLLLNTQNMYSAVSGKILAEHGKESDWNFKMKVIGRRADEVAEMAVSHYNLPYTPQQYLSLHQEECHALFPTCDLLPGVENLLRHLHSRNVKMAVATSSKRDIMEIKTVTKHSEIFSLFSHIVTGCDPELMRGKPDPQIYNIARSRFTDAPLAENCLVFEDAPNGVEAALACGMQVVMVPHHKVKKEFLLPATQVLASLEDFQPQDFGLPPYSAPTSQ